MSDAITIRKLPDDRYADILEAAKFYSPQYGGKANALAYMVRESKLYQEWRRRNVTKRLRDDSTTAP